MKATTVKAKDMTFKAWAGQGDLRVEKRARVNKNNNGNFIGHGLKDSNWVWTVKHVNAYNVMLNCCLYLET